MSAHGTFNATAVTLWDDAKVHALGEDARTLFVYLLTNRQRVAEGFYSLPIVLANDQLAWDFARLSKAAEELKAADLATYDMRAQVVLIVKGLKFNAPNTKQIPAAVKKLDTVQDAPEMFGRFLSAADRYCPDLAIAIRSRYGLSGDGLSRHGNQSGMA